MKLIGINMDENKIEQYRIGIDLGGTNIKVGIVDLDNHILRQESIPTYIERPWKDIIKSMADLTNSIILKERISIDRCLGIGVGSPGLIDTKNGIVLYSNNFEWENIPLRRELQKYFNLPIKMSNDANCAALGEAKAGAAKDKKNVVLLTLGTGVGGGIILDGVIFEGGGLGGAELGHMTIVAGGITCTCGHKGCLEMYASASALIRQCEEAIVQYPQSKMNNLKDSIGKMRGDIPFAAAKENDLVAQNVLAKYIGYLGDGIIGIINVFRPEVILISGGVSNAGNELIKPLKSYVKSRTFGRDWISSGEICCAALKNSAGIIGAANL